MKMAQGSPDLLLSVFLSSGDHDLQGCRHEEVEQTAKEEGKVSSPSPDPACPPVPFPCPIPSEDPGSLLVGWYWLWESL